MWQDGGSIHASSVLDSKQKDDVLQGIRETKASGLVIQADIKEFLDGRGVQWEEVDDLAAVAGDADVLYQTRIQKERFQVGSRGT